VAEIKSKANHKGHRGNTEEPKNNRRATSYAKRIGNLAQHSVISKSAGSTAHCPGVLLLERQLSFFKKHQ
jgi:hypothetical protein